MKPTKIIIELDLESELFRDNAEEAYLGALGALSQRAWAFARRSENVDHLLKRIAPPSDIFARGRHVGQIRVAHKKETTR